MTSVVYRLAVLRPDMFATGVYPRWADKNYKAVARHVGRDGKAGPVTTPFEVSRQEVGDEPGRTECGGSNGRGVEGLCEGKGLPGQVMIWGQLALVIQGFVLKHAFLHLAKDCVVPNIDIRLATSFAMCVSDYRIWLQFRIWNSFAGSH